jgi:Domain of unknown function (DUF4292)
MKHLLLVVCIMTLMAASCRKPKKLNTSNPADTTIIQGLKPKIDTPKVAFVLDREIPNLDFKYLSSDTKIDFTDGTNDSKFKVKMRIRKDSAVWLSMQANIGVEGIRILATKDSIQMINYQEKTYRVLSYKALSEEYGFDFTYDLMQGVLIGEMPIKRFDKRNVLKDTSYYIVRQMEKFLNIDNYLNQKNLKLEKLNVKDSNTGSVMEMLYTEFVVLGTGLFAEKNNIDLKYYNKKGFYKINIEIDHKKTKITNEALAFPFKIPGKYKKMD